MNGFVIDIFFFVVVLPPIFKMIEVDVQVTFFEKQRQSLSNRFDLID